MVQVLIELKYLATNPARLVQSRSEKSGERQVYLAHRDFMAMVANRPPWLKPIALTGYFSGMKQGQILGLTRDRVQ